MASKSRTNRARSFVPVARLRRGDVLADRMGRRPRKRSKAPSAEAPAGPSRFEAGEYFATLQKQRGLTEFDETKVRKRPKGWTYQSLVAVLEHWFDKRFNELPAAQRKRVESDFFPMPWDQLSPHDRREVALQWDAQNDPSKESEMDGAFAELAVINAKIQQYELVNTPTALDLAERYRQLNTLHKERDQLKKRLRGAKQPTVQNESDCKSWLLNLMRGNSTPAESKVSYRETAKQRFNVGVRGFDRAWLQAVKESGNKAWSTPGRKSKQRIDTPK